MKWLTNRHTKDVYNDVYPYKVHIGRPEPSERYTVEELEQMGIVGVYRVDENITFGYVIMSNTHNAIFQKDFPT